MKMFILLVVNISIITGGISFPSTSNGEKRLIQFSEEGPEWLSLNEIEATIAKRIHFIDITDHQVQSNIKSPKLFDIPDTIRYRAAVRNTISHLNISRIQNFLIPFSEFFNRYYTSESGVASSNWLFDQIQNAIDKSGYPGRASVQHFTHDWPQSSVIARIQGSDSTSSTPLVILGSHLDCVTTGEDGLAPGADDNGSGSATILEALIAILESGFLPKITLEFHWYAAEEVGLRGAQDIVKKYLAEGIEVLGMANFDMTGYLTADPRIAIIADYTDADLNQFIRLIVDEYTDVGYADKICGYGCSDHAAWNASGFRSTFPHELAASPYVHTVRDTTDNLSFPRILDFSKIAVAFAIELAEPRMK